MLGAVLGLALATVFVHSRLLERAFVPVRRREPDRADHRPRADDHVRVRRQSVASVVVIATYLTFFPVTIAMIRGPALVRPAGHGADALVRRLALGRSTGSCACRRRCRTCSRPSRSRRPRASSARSSARDRAASPDGLGRVIITFNQYYITGPEKLWAAIIASACSGSRSPRSSAPSRSSSFAAGPARRPTD